MRDDVVVLPWVPVTRIIFFPAAAKKFKAWGMEQKAIFLSIVATASRLVLKTAFPTTTRSVAGSILSGLNPLKSLIPLALRKSLMGG